MAQDSYEVETRWVDLAHLVMVERRGRSPLLWPASRLPRHMLEQIAEQVNRDIRQITSPEARPSQSDPEYPEQGLWPWNPFEKEL